MTQKTYRGGEGQNTPQHSPHRPGPDLPKRSAPPSHGIARTERGEDQPADKARARQVHRTTPEPQGIKEQRDAAEQQPPSPGEPAGHE